MKRRAVVLIAMTLALSGCRRTIPVTEVAAGVPPFDQLEGVQLEMRAWRLVRRPNVVPAPYYGFSEQLGQFTIRYEVAGSLDDDQAPPLYSRVLSVVVDQSLPNDSVPIARWQTEVKRLSQSVGTRPECHYQTSPRTGWTAVWSRSTADLFVRGIAAGAVQGMGLMPASIRVGVARRGSALRIGAHTPCDSLGL
jgi:hypothetical protein